MLTFKYGSNESALRGIYYTTLCGFWIKCLVTLVEEAATQAAPRIVMAAFTVELLEIRAHHIEQLQHLVAHTIRVVKPETLLSVAQQAIRRRYALRLLNQHTIGS